jgi:hypothetical protein
VLVDEPVLADAQAQQCVVDGLDEAVRSADLAEALRVAEVRVQEVRVDPLSFPLGLVLAREGQHQIVAEIASSIP